MQQTILDFFAAHTSTIMKHRVTAITSYAKTGNDTKYKTKAKTSINTKTTGFWMTEQTRFLYFDKTMPAG